MRRRQTAPRRYLMTDERMGDRLWIALERLPRGAGVIFRHYALGVADRRALFERVRRIARARGLVLILAGSARQAVGWKADGVHGRSGERSSRPLIRTAPVHDRRERIAAERAGADALLISPVFPTRSHEGASALGRVRFGMLARGACAPVIALGGMRERRFGSVRPLGAAGWAGIDSWGPA